jgi:pyrimidine-nucleoside phosphorylase
MDAPLGYMVGNFLEVEESIACLEGKGWEADFNGDTLSVRGPSADLMEVTIQLSAWMLVVSKVVDTFAAGVGRSLEVLGNRKALEHFWKNVDLQGGSREKAEALIGDRGSLMTYRISAEKSGYISNMDAFKIGTASVLLGAGRNVASDDVLPDVGIEIHKKPGEKVESGDSILTLYARDQKKLDSAREYLDDALAISSDKPSIPAVIHSVIE